jgi:glycosyltransferase 2 family protein
MNLRKTYSIVTLIICIIVVVIILHSTNFEKAFKILKEIKLRWLVSAVLINIINTWIESVRWKLIVSSIKKGIKIRNTFEALVVGVLGNVILPFRLGDGVRAYFFSKKENLGLASVLSTVILDRIADVTMFLIILAITALFFTFPSSVEEFVIFIVIVIVILFSIFIIMVKFRHRLKLKSKGRISQWLTEQIKSFIAGFSALRNARLLLPTGILSAISWAMRLMIVWAMLISFGMNLQLVVVLATLILTNLGIAVVSTPANIGGFELSAVAALKLFSVDLESAISYAIALHLAEVVPIVIIAIFIVWHTGFKLTSLNPLKEELDYKK